MRTEAALGAGGERRRILAMGGGGFTMERSPALDKFVLRRCPDMVDTAGWNAIDEAEMARGGGDRPRDKFTAVADMLAAAATAPTPPIGRRVLAGLRR